MSATIQIHDSEPETIRPIGYPCWDCGELFTPDGGQSMWCMRCHGKRAHAASKSAANRELQTIAQEIDDLKARIDAYRQNHRFADSAHDLKARMDAARRGKSVKTASECKCAFCDLLGHSHMSQNDRLDFDNYLLSLSQQLEYAGRKVGGLMI